MMDMPDASDIEQGGMLRPPRSAPPSAPTASPENPFRTAPATVSAPKASNGLTSLPEEGITPEAIESNLTYMDSNDLRQILQDVVPQLDDDAKHAVLLLLVQISKPKTVQHAPAPHAQPMINRSNVSVPAMNHALGLAMDASGLVNGFKTVSKYREVVQSMLDSMTETLHLE